MKSTAQRLLQQFKDLPAFYIADRLIYAIHQPNQHITRYYFHDKSCLELKLTSQKMLAWDYEDDKFILKLQADCRVNKRGVGDEFKRIKQFRVVKGVSKFLITKGWFYDKCVGLGLIEKRGLFENKLCKNI